jgi:hypothetical protein
MRKDDQYWIDYLVGIQNIFEWILLMVNESFQACYIVIFDLQLV